MIKGTFLRTFLDVSAPPLYAWRTLLLDPLPPCAYVVNESPLVPPSRIYLESSKIMDEKSTAIGNDAEATAFLLVHKKVLYKKLDTLISTQIF